MSPGPMAKKRTTLLSKWKTEGRTLPWSYNEWGGHPRLPALQTRCVIFSNSFQVSALAQEGECVGCALRPFQCSYSLRPWPFGASGEASLRVSLVGLHLGFLQKDVFRKSEDCCWPYSSCPWAVSLFSIPSYSAPASSLEVVSTLGPRS